LSTVPETVPARLMSVPPAAAAIPARPPLAGLALAAPPVTVATAGPAEDTMPETVPVAFWTRPPPLFTAAETVPVTALTADWTEPALGLEVAADPAEPALWAAEPVAAEARPVLLVLLVLVLVAAWMAVVTVPVTWATVVGRGTVPETAEDREPADGDTAPTVGDTAPATEPTMPDTAETSESPGPVGACVAAAAEPASIVPRPIARQTPPATAPKANNNTLRTGEHQPFMPGTLIT
jgi:hypothetical protein